MFSPKLILGVSAKGRWGLRISIEVQKINQAASRMEDRETQHPSQTSTLHQSRTSTVLGGPHPSVAKDKAPDRRLLEPPAVGLDWALAPTYRCLPSADNDFAKDYGLFLPKLLVTRAKSGEGGGGGGT